ncbi:MAG: site-specific integrase [Phycisphaerae bacterium]|nr:site-specific integrase [Phycisphaerae bacterium]
MAKNSGSNPVAKKAAKNTKKNTPPPGCIYDKRGRFYWKGRLPGSKKFCCLAVKADGTKFALRADESNKAAAYEIVWRWFRKAEANASVLSVADLVAVYLEHARVYYRRKDGTLTSESTNIEVGTRLLVSKFGTMPADDLTKKHVHELRDIWISEGKAYTTINKYMGFIKRMYHWASDEQDYVSESTFHSVDVVRNLVMWRTEARVPDPVGPADPRSVDAAMEHMPVTLWRMVALHRLAGFRSTELCILRPKHIDRGGDVWVYEPEWSKEEHKRIPRKIHLGPIAQEILAPMLNRPEGEFCFQPEAVQCERWKLQRLHRQTPVQPSQVARGQKKARKFEPRFDKATYYQAVEYAQNRAKKSCEGFVEWSPHQLRHSFINGARSLFGAEKARAAGGHASLDATEIYLERDMAAAADVAKQIG